MAYFRQTPREIQLSKEAKRAERSKNMSVSGGNKGECSGVWSNGWDYAEMSSDNQKDSVRGGFTKKHVQMAEPGEDEPQSRRGRPIRKPKK